MVVVSFENFAAYLEGFQVRQISPDLLDPLNGWVQSTS